MLQEERDRPLRHLPPHNILPTGPFQNKILDYKLRLTKCNVSI